MISKRILVLFLSLGFAPITQAQVVTSITDFEWLGTRLVESTPIKVKALLDGTENPHFVDASPGFVTKVASAKVLVYVGLDLEVGWLPKVVQRAGNAEVQKGAQGACDLSGAITPLEVRTGPVDRSMGDIHPDGNPHYWLGYREFAMVAARLATCLSAVWPGQKPVFLENLKKLQGEIIGEERAVQALVKPVLGANPNILEYHREYSYFLKSFGYQSRATLESKPGVSPSAGRIAEVGTAARRENTLFLLSAPYYPKGVHSKFTEISGVRVLEMATQWIPGEFPSPLAQRRALVSRMIEAAKSAPKPP